MRQEPSASPNEPSILVYDVGGSHISAATCIQRGYQLGVIATASTGDISSASDFIALLCSLGDRANTGAQKINGVELAFPGPFEYENGISRMEHKFPFLFGVDLRTPLAAHFGLPPECVRFINDAAAYCAGEVGAGAGQGASRVVTITLGTGIGSGFAVDGALVISGRGVPLGGEIWNLPYGGGIVEDQLSTHYLVADYKRRTGLEISVKEIASRVPTDPSAHAVFQDFGNRLGTTLRSILGDFSPEVVVLGGGISRSAQLFLPAASKALDGQIQLRVAQLQNKAPLVGAAVLWFTSTNRT